MRLLTKFETCLVLNLSLYCLEDLRKAKKIKTKDVTYDKLRKKYHYDVEEYLERYDIKLKPDNLWFRLIKEEEMLKDAKSRKTRQYCPTYKRKVKALKSSRNKT